MRPGFSALQLRPYLLQVLVLHCWVMKQPQPEGHHNKEDKQRQQPALQRGGPKGHARRACWGKSWWACSSVGRGSRLGTALSCRRAHACGWLMHMGARPACSV